MNNENSINGREEAWPRLGRQASSIMYRPNQPASIVLPQTRAARLPQPLPSPSYSSKSSSTHAGSSLNPSYYSVSPPSARDALPTSSPLVKQRTAPADPSQHTGMPGLPPFILTNGKLASCPSPSPSGTTTLSESEDDRLIHHQHCGHARSGSAETLRGPLLSTTNLTEDNNSRASSECSNHPLTPFPEYISQGSSVDRSLTGSSADTVLRTSSTIPGGEGQKHQLPVEDSARIPARGTDRRHLVLLLREEDGDAPGRFPRFQRRPTSMSPSMHALVLGLECAVLLVVGSALLWVTVSKKRTSDQHFWTWLWTFGEPLVGALLLLCFAILVTHEVRPLSTVAHLYLQSGVLVLTTLAAVTLVARCLEQESRAVKGVITGCCMWMWATMFLGFLRAVVVWKVESMGSQGDRDGYAADYDCFNQERNAVAYGTFTMVGNT